MPTKQLILLTIIILICVNAVFGQDTSSYRINSLLAGAKALQFEMNFDFQSSRFRSSYLSYKVQTSSRSSTRFGLSVSNSSRDSLTFIALSDGRLDKTETDFSSWSIQITAHRVYNSRQNRRLSFYWGLGPTAGFSRSNQDRVRTLLYGGILLPPIQEDFKFSETERWNVGAYFIGGMEFFIFKSVSLIFVRAASFEYTWFKSTIIRESFIDGTLFFSDEEEENSQPIVMRQNRLRLGLSVYF